MSHQAFDDRNTVLFSSHVRLSSTTQEWRKMKAEQKRQEGLRQQAVPNTTAVLPAPRKSCFSGLVFYSIPWVLTFMLFLKPLGFMFFPILASITGCAEGTSCAILTTAGQMIGMALVVVFTELNEAEETWCVALSL